MEESQYQRLHPRDLRIGHVVKLGDYAWSSAVILKVEGPSEYGLWTIHVARPHLDASPYGFLQPFQRVECFTVLEDGRSVNRWLHVHKETIKHPRVIDRGGIEETKESA